MKSFKSKIGNPRGSFANKEHRAQRLVNNWNRLERKMVSFIEQGNGTTLRARCAYGVLLMMETGIRVGNESSAEGYICENKYHPLYGKEVRTYGLTTLLSSHVSKNGAIRIRFTGKKGVEQYLKTSHPVLMEWFRTVQKHEFAYEDSFLGIAYADLVWFVKRYVGRKFMPKDIRTVRVNIEFIKRMSTLNGELEHVTTKSSMKKILSEKIAETAEHIGHTKSVCKSAYISKQLIGAYESYLERRRKENADA